MATEAPKTHRLVLRGHSEEVTEKELAAVKEMTGDRFSEYTVEDIQPTKPADVPSAPAKAKKEADTPAV